MAVSLNYLTTHEVAALLKLSYDGALAFIKYSGVRYSKFGLQYRVEEGDLKAFLTQQGNVVVDLQPPVV